MEQKRTEPPLKRPPEIRSNPVLESIALVAPAVSHEPFQIDVRLGPKIKSAMQKKPALKRLSKSPLKKKARTKTVVTKKTPTVEQPPIIKTEPECSQRTEDVDREHLLGTTIDVDDQLVSPLMSDGLWDIFEIVSKRCATNYTVVRSIIGMIDKGFTLPFICRYRRDQSGGLSPEVIQSIREEYSTLVEVRKKAKALVTKLGNEGNNDEGLKQAILSSRTLEELNTIMEPMKQKGRKTHAARARSIGLDAIAMPIWREQKTLRDFSLEKFIDPSVPGKADSSDLLQSIRYILADELRRSRAVLDLMEDISRQEAELHVKQKKQAKSQKVFTGKECSDNFRDYFDFARKVSAMESHQILAINRGEQQGFLSVNVHLTMVCEKHFKKCLEEQFHERCLLDPATRKLIRDAVDDSFDRLCKPYISRVARTHLKDRAEKEALTVFSCNLRALLMTPPVRGESVLGIDPGFTNGCKLAVISKSGDLLESAMMYLKSRPEQVLVNLVLKHRCHLIAVGDGKGCREVKRLISSCNERRLFGDQPVRFTTVREAGVSIYSVSKAAEEELPGLDCFVRGAVVIARRLQDPLVEFIKVEPKNLGVGMYQHDINESRLKEALQSTVVECVSYVGVDVNVCPEFLLRQVAGLNATAAKNIIAHRKQNGPFNNREQLQLVPHIGPKRYEQCAGFVKILPETLKQCLDDSLIVVKVKKPNEKAISEELEPLDSTIIHPESYDLTRKIISHLGLDVRCIGTQNFIDRVKERAKADELVRMFDSTLLTVELILKALKVKRNSDVRDEGCAPIFNAGNINMANIQIGQKLSGRVENVVPFGAFVDIAMDKDALIHNGQLGAARGIIKLGDIVECRVIKKDAERQRISLAFESFR
ncbi:S1 RNA-binding domain-containing protein 1 [Galendromus occidentalis]|uniref:S1 RNA-binding domain-containing protein 1 n=1 Tax=Galendromus occidentalis TaxID=34638 RepID=A0AAJ6QNW3_9ACAR|nr:S1 RNA-binding domain-containing protein 1 [Galendromus occidentalis]